MGSSGPWQFPVTAACIATAMPPRKKAEVVAPEGAALRAWLAKASPPSAAGATDAAVAAPAQAGVASSGGHSAKAKASKVPRVKLTPEEAAQQLHEKYKAAKIKRDERALERNQAKAQAK